VREHRTRLKAQEIKWPPPRHADSLAPDYGRGRALRLRAGGRQRLATVAAQPRTGTRRAALLGRSLKKLAKGERRGQVGATGARGAEPRRRAEYSLEPTDWDEGSFAQLMPADHSLRRRKAAIDCEPWRALGADCDAVGRGAPAADPVRLRNLRLVPLQYDRSDTQVVRQAQGNGALRFFLD
jgi:hypothetical protein